MLFSFVSFLFSLWFRIPPATSGRRSVGTQVATCVSWVCLSVYQSNVYTYVCSPPTPFASRPSFPLPYPLFHFVVSTSCPCGRSLNLSCIYLCSFPYFGFEFHPPYPGGVELARKCRPAYPGSVYRSTIPLCVHISTTPPFSILPRPTPFAKFPLPPSCECIMYVCTSPNFVVHFFLCLP